ncbi:MAG TPA: glycosyltransferase family 1 protein, partial [Streptomyces sp.]|nr:glycosyltransferase family 1 protein [Streptomyces sp.]
TWARAAEGTVAHYREAIARAEGRPARGAASAVPAADPAVETAEIVEAAEATGTHEAVAAADDVDETNRESANRESRATC